ncbi:MAG: LLM class F420-dependent oxidoreductase [Actinobacteria bacterium]|nr:LLM class F420-dependent oxidoreductase [Actinomycetota bacterium]
MKFGLTTFATDEGLPPAELARLAEDAGFESVLFPDHTHIPAGRQSPSPRGGDLPWQYFHTIDPFVASSFAAAATKELKVGTAICLIAQRDPIATAKTVASLDFLAGGRVLFGVGAGWNAEEMRNHGTEPRTRFKLMAERVKAMKAIWVDEEAEYHGDFVDFAPLFAWPKPLSAPHPPVLVGGNGKTVIDRVLDFGDEWLPEPEDGLDERILELKERGRAAGRGDIPVTVHGAAVEEVERLAEVGVHRCTFWVPARGPAEAEARIAELVQELALG